MQAFRVWGGGEDKVSSSLELRADSDATAPYMVEMLWKNKRPEGDWKAECARVRRESEIVMMCEKCQGVDFSYIYTKTGVGQTACNLWLISPKGILNVLTELQENSPSHT